jgi:segregation and condensation protein A
MVESGTQTPSPPATDPPGRALGTAAGPAPSHHAPPYQVSTAVFEGPFDLLLHLILKEEVDLWEVNLARIVDAYLVEVERIERLDLDVATEFLLIAATLVELKSRRLLPGRETLELDEELLRFEERDLLLARLLDCKTFQDAAVALEARLAEGSRRFPRSAGPPEPFRSLAPDPLEQVSPERLGAAARAALAPRPEPTVDTDHVAPVRASVRDAIEVVLGLLPPSRAVSFRELATGADSKLEVIVRFLAVLELFKQGIVEVDQATTFGDLFVRALEAGEHADLRLARSEWDDEWDDDDDDGNGGDDFVDLEERTIDLDATVEVS